jgi:hypothetical protein
VRPGRDEVRLPLVDRVDASEHDKLVHAPGQAEHEAHVRAIGRQHAVAVEEKRIGEDAQAQGRQGIAVSTSSWRAP